MDKEFIRFLGKTWTIDILGLFILSNKMTFSMILKEFNGRINHTLLSDRLYTLVAYNILEREEVGYSITEKGIETFAALSQLG